MSLTIVTSSRFADHLTPSGHPERVERFEVMQALAHEFRDRGAALHEPRAARRDEIERIHAAEYVERVAGTAGRATAFDADTFTSPDTYEVACLAAGAAISAVEHVLGDAAAGRMAAGPDASATPAAGSPGLDRRRAIALVRPPGHHAERDRAMGFCFFNNVAIAAAHARARGLARVAVVDVDVHHGNGTQWSFYTDPTVLVVSTHQFPYYPGTGAADEIGSAAGQGFTINLPLSAGATDADYGRVYDRLVIPVLRQFRPELLLVSAGFDAHVDDPLGGMRVTAEGFGRLMARLAQVADDCCGGRLVSVVEGGYDLRGLADSLRASMTALAADEPVAGVGPDGDTPFADACLAAVKPYLATYWPLEQPS